MRWLATFNLNALCISPRDPSLQKASVSLVFRNLSAFDVSWAFDVFLITSIFRATFPRTWKRHPSSVFALSANTIIFKYVLYEFSLDQIDAILHWWPPTCRLSFQDLSRIYSLSPIQFYWCVFGENLQLETVTCSWKNTTTLYSDWVLQLRSFPWSERKQFSLFTFTNQ